MTDKYEIAVRKWIASKQNLDWEKISNVEFGQEWSGGCETCGYDYITIITITYTYNGRQNDIGSISYDSPATMLREMSELVE